MRLFEYITVNEKNGMALNEKNGMAWCVLFTREYLTYIYGKVHKS